MKTKSGLAMPAFLSPCSAASRPATFGLWWCLVPTPALVVMSVPPDCQEHLSLGRFARHLSLTLPGLPVVSAAIHRLSSVRGEAQAGPLSLYGPTSQRLFMHNTARTSEECATA